MDISEMPIPLPFPPAAPIRQQPLYKRNSAMIYNNDSQLNIHQTTTFAFKEKTKQPYVSGSEKKGNFAQWPNFCF